MTTTEVIVAVLLVINVMEAVRRVVSMSLFWVICFFLAYAWFGQYIPGLFRFSGISFPKLMEVLMYGENGIFGSPLVTSLGTLFYFLVFGTFFSNCGGGGVLIDGGMKLSDKTVGGPAKAAVISSGLLGMVSGSAIANVSTTGVLTIPLMKKTGYSKDFAGAVEASSSVGGQLLPPVMGAAAFLMVEYVGIPYTQIIKHAALPAIMSYIALFYIVHLEACKAGIQGIPRETIAPLKNRLINILMTVSGVIILANVVYYGLGWIKGFAGESSVFVIAALMLAAYIGLLKYEAGYPELHLDDPNAPILKCPEVGPTVKSGLHFLLPVVALIWNLMIEELSPALSAFWATMFLIFILVTQRPLSAWFRGKNSVGEEVAEGFRDLKTGLVAGSRNMIGVAIATSTAGIIVGTVTLTGIGLVLADVVEMMSAGNLFMMLCWVAIASLILGMGVPTTANYIIVSSLMAPVVVELGAQSGLIVPLIAIHMFVFYFGIMADVTPPVGLAAYAAAGIAKADPLVTGFTAFWYSIRTSVLPFMFIYNTQLLLIGIDSVPHFILVVTSAVVASLLFVAASQNWFLTRSRWYETALLLLIAFSLFRPGFWMDRIAPQFETIPSTQLIQLIEKAPADDQLRVWVEGEDINGDPVKKGMLLPLGEPGSAAQRLERFGLRIIPSGEQFSVMSVKFRSSAAKAGFQVGQLMTSIEVETDRPKKEWIYVPVLFVLALVVVLQRRRIATEARVA